MRRYRDDRPADICLARGTFNAHPYVMAAMNEFLHRLETPEMQRLYDGLDELGNSRAANDEPPCLTTEELPVRVENLSSIWTVCYTRPSRYNWMLQYYLRAEGLVLSWVGTGRLIFSLNYSDADFAAVMDRFLAAAQAMERDGWWWTARQQQQVDQAAGASRDAGQLLGARGARPGPSDAHAITVSMCDRLAPSKNSPRNRWAGAR